MVDVVRDILGDLLGEIRPYSPQIRPAEFRVNTGFSPDSPLSPARLSETHSPRAVLRFRLIENQGGGTVVGAEGQSLADLRAALQRRYGNRLEWTDR